MSILDPESVMPEPFAGKNIEEVKGVVRLASDRLDDVVRNSSLIRSVTDNHSRRMEMFNVDTEFHSADWESIAINVPEGTLIISITDFFSPEDPPSVYAIGYEAKANVGLKDLIDELTEAVTEITDTLDLFPYHLIMIPMNEMPSDTPMYYECPNLKSMLEVLRTRLKTVSDEFQLYIIKGERFKLTVTKPTIAFGNQILDIPTDKTLELIDLGLA